MAGEIRLVARKRGWYDIWVDGVQLPESVRLDDCGDLTPLVYDEEVRRLFRKMREREGLL